jgi:hypothetical protein
LRENGDWDLDKDLSDGFSMMKRPALNIGISSYITDFIRKVQNILQHIEINGYSRWD